MKMHEHVTCKVKKTSWAQPNPNLPAHKQFNMYNTQPNAWKYNYNAHGMQCMKFLRLNLQNPSQKFQQ